MVLIIIFIIILAVMFSARNSKVGRKRCWDASPGEPKVHTWILQDVPDSKQIILICKVCGQRPGEE